MTWQYVEQADHSGQGRKIRREKKMADWRRSLRKVYAVLKLGISFLLVGLALRLFIENTPYSTDTVNSFNPIGNADRIYNPQKESGLDKGGKCDLFVGDWVRYDGDPIYTNDTCGFIEDHQNCLKNGRPDNDYIHWRWKPRGCELGRLEPERFLEMMRNKSWAFIGDSISRNHVQSFLCVLSTAEKAIEVYHDEAYKSRRWIFPDHNFTVSVIWSPFLAKAAIFEDINGVSTSEIQLHLDTLDKNWTDTFNSFDYATLSSGEWFAKTAIYYENNIVIGSHNLPKLNFTELGFNFAYQKVIREVFRYIFNSGHKGKIFYRTTTPDHYEGGEWYNGGKCERTLPAKEGEFKLNEVTRILRDIELQEFEIASIEGSEGGVDFQIFDVGPLSLLRPDGHPGPYRFFQPFAKGNEAKPVVDCLHWCLPGPIDSWNDVLMEMTLNG